MMKIKQIGMIAAVGLAVLAAPLAANANGFGENKAWQFRSPSDLVAHLMQAELMEKKEGGAFDNYGPGNTYMYSSTAIGNYNETNIGAGACQGENACTVDTDQDNKQSPTTAIGIGHNTTTNNGGGGQPY